MTTEVEGTFDVAGGKSLYTKSWLPAGTPKANVVFVHGFSDHINRYQNLFASLAARGIAVHGFDQRGWGRSVSKPAEKGLTGPTATVIADLAAFIKQHLQGSCPVFVLGHSMGGGEALTLACDPQYHDSVVKHVRGWLLESPFIGFAKEETPSWLKILAGRLAGKLLPHKQLLHVLPPENLSTDPATVKSLAEDKLMHNTGTLEGLSGLLDRTTALTTGAARPNGGAVRALWIGHGTVDKATSFEISNKYFDEFMGDVKDKEFKVYEGWYHQLHADGKRSEKFFKDVGDWILARCDDAGATTTVGSKL
ncbi:Alpha/Beta hydrolase protein [Apodospora peruviana]|uniref:Alpha/Beta hydrolase protein n=1 Tax=Apodospora peruviana TaxID=516989 RepID=A0AAE0IJE6_9PEZI|nr:Alpha/Beta hydrolase protein [Apodospora peruviana]